MDSRPWLKWYPPQVPHELENHSEAESFISFFDERFSSLRGRIAIRHGQRDYSYADLDSLTLGLAAYFQARGLSAGSRIAVALPNSCHYVVAAIAVIRAGMVLVNVNPAYTPREFGIQINDADADTVILLRSQFDALKQAIAETKLRCVIQCDLERPIEVESNERDFAPLLSDNIVFLHQAILIGKNQVYAKPKPSARDTVVLQYTGGTTGISKGAMLSHGGLLANTAQNAALFGPALKDIDTPVLACALPLYHIVSFISLLASFRLGGTVLLIPDPRDSSQMLGNLKMAAFHMLPGINTLFSSLMKDPEFDSVDWSTLKVATAGGMPTHPSIAKKWFERTGCEISEGYGLSETSGTVSCNPPHGEIRQGTVGPPAPSTDVVILDRELVPQPQGKSGQIAVRGPQLFKGYWRREAETRVYFTDNGFFLTGDIGYFDDHGYLCISGREKEMILVSGFNVYPNEIEAVAAQLELVLECAAVGVADIATGEAVKLVVVACNNALTEEIVRKHMKDNLTAYKQPKTIEFRDRLPRSAVGKLLRASL